MCITPTENADLVSYQLQGVAHPWYKQWKKNRGTDVGLIEWDEFVISFLDKLFSLELRESKVQECINQKEDNMSMKECSLKFTHFGKYTSVVVVDSRS